MVPSQAISLKRAIVIKIIAGMAKLIKQFFLKNTKKAEKASL